MKLQQIQSFITLIKIIKSAYTQPNVDESLFAILTLIEDAIKNELQGEILSGKLTPNDMKYIEGKNHAKFTDKEIDKMPRKFRSLFKTRKLYAHVRKTEDDVYEVRRVHKGHIIMGTSKDLVKAKAKFIECLHQINFNAPPSNAKSNYLVEYMEEWLKITKKPFIKESTFVNHQRAFSAYIKPHFQNKKLSECTYFEIQSYLNEFSNTGKHRTAKSVYLLLSSMFNYAVADGILPRSPMAKSSSCVTNKNTASL